MVWMAGLSISRTMRGGLGERQHHVALGRGQRLDQHRDAALLRLRRDTGQAVDELRVASSRSVRRWWRAASASRRP